MFNKKYGIIPTFDSNPCLTDRFDKCFVDGEYTETEISGIYKLNETVRLPIAQENFIQERAHKSIYYRDTAVAQIFEFNVYRIFEDIRLRYYKLECHVDDGDDADGSGFGMEPPVDIFTYINKGNTPLFPFYNDGLRYCVSPKLKKLTEELVEAYSITIINNDTKKILDGKEPMCPICRQILH